MTDEKKPAKLTLVQGGAVEPSSTSVACLKALGLPVVPIRVEEIFLDVPEQPTPSPRRPAP